ncbi:MAG: TrkA family potassium uptake protein [bacterium]|nr:TrkA family potassium uptake protein [bacterium]
MYIIVAGGGTIGSEIISKFTELKKEIVLIEKDQQVCDELYTNYGIETINGNATKIEILKAAGIEKANVLIITMPNDADNLACAVLAKSFGVPEIIVLMRKKSYLEAYKTVGVNKILNVVDILVRDTVNQVDKPDVQRIATLGNGAVEIFIIKIPEDAKIVGQTISEIASTTKLTQESIIAGIFDKNQNEFKVPRGNTVIPAGAELFVITKPDYVDSTAKVLTSKK